MSYSRIKFCNKRGEYTGEVFVSEGVRTILGAIKEAKDMGESHVILTEQWCGRSRGETAVPVEGIREITSS